MNADFLLNFSSLFKIRAADSLTLRSPINKDEACKTAKSFYFPFILVSLSTRAVTKIYL